MSLKGFFIILVLLNLSIAGLIWLQPVQKPEPFSMADAGIAPLTLLSEFDASQGMVDQVSARNNGPSQTTACFSLGPFPTQTDARRAMGVIAADVHQARIRQSEAVQTLGYWVYLPAVAIREQALAHARNLAELGVRDYYVVTAGDKENTVSLGLFSIQANAVTRLDDMKSLGFDARMSIRKEKRPVYFVDYATLDQQFPDWLNAIQSNRSASQEPAPCF